MSENILVLSFELMMLGMGFVFIFLIVLVFATGAMSNLVTKYLPEPEPKPVVARKPSAAAAKAQIDSTTMAVIAAALKQHRSRHKK
ncbi:MAG: OadG family protein [Hahellaceae bacterium]|nr:OadG family protein [Hahellaceae bacterium]